MEPFDSIEKWINEHGSAAIRGERIEQLREFSTALELKLKDLQARNDALERAAGESRTREEALKSQLICAHEEIKRLNQKCEDAKKLTSEDLATLQFMDTAGDTVYPHQVAATLDIAESRAIWLLDRLRDLERIFKRPTIPHTYFISQKGRDAIHNPSA